MRVRLAKKINAVIAIAAGVLVTLVVVVLLQVAGKRIVGGKSPEDSALIFQPGNLRPSPHSNYELMGFTIGLFLGTIVTGILAKTKARHLCLLIPLFSLSLIILLPWKFNLQKELLLLFLPMWMLISLFAWYCAHCLSRFRARRKLASIR
ncbi:MAG: hypothetical protein H7Y42_15545 [Chitinophagaceae bacterium]|nr:hypothetical protein [Chitinophagaceae bacterium]